MKNTKYVPPHRRNQTLELTRHGRERQEQSEVSEQSIHKEEIIQVLHEVAEKCLEKEPYRIGRILGDIYTEGNLISPDFDKALFWYKKAAHLNNSKAMYKLGKLLEDKDVPESKNWFAKYTLHQENNPTPQEKLELTYISGKNYHNGLNGKPKNVIQATVVENINYNTINELNYS